MALIDGFFLFLFLLLYLLMISMQVTNGGEIAIGSVMMNPRHPAPEVTWSRGHSALL